jgi:hypothetical protein
VNRRLAYVALYGLLLVLALRMTMTETARVTLGQITGQAVVQKGEAALPEIGPAVTTGLAAAVVVLAGLAAWCGARAGALGRARLGRWVIVIAILVLGGFSTFAAANRFLALVGWCDLGMALIAGGSIGVLCDARVLGATGRRTVIAAIVALVSVWTAKGLYQRAIDIPETIQYYQLHRDEALAQALGPNHSTDPHSSEVKLFESRMLSEEVTGYVTLSNVMATGMVGLLAVLAGVLATRKVDPLEEDDELQQRANEISWPMLNAWVAGLLLAAGLAVLFLTASRGGSVVGVAAVVAILGGAFCWRAMVARRRLILAGVGMLVVLGAAAVIGYGLKNDRLPSKSLMFRWHYWTASAKLVEQSPMLGVGLNNFGDYYTSVKRASSPEDVKDPHSFFVRIAAEVGLPAMGLVLVLIVWLVMASTRGVGVETPLPWDVRNAMVGGAFFCAVWWCAHQLLAEPANEYSVILSVLSAIIAAAAWALACGMLSLCGARGLRFVAISGVVGAMGMLLYDQINMALVTGPVAMFFWMLLGVGESFDGGRNAAVQAVGVKKPGALAVLNALLLGGAGLVVGAWVWWPTLSGTMPWDAGPFEERYVAAVAESPPNFAVALESLNGAIARSPRSTDLLHQRVLVELQLHQSTSADIERILSLDHSSARLRVSLAMVDEEISPAVRIGMLQEAVRLDAQLPADEVTRLSTQEHQAIDAKIAELMKAPTRVER